MKTKLFKLLAGLVLILAPAFSQSIDVTSTGVEIGATATGATGAVIKQEGSAVSILTKDGVNPAELQVIVTEDGNVGVGVAAPEEKLEVEGNAVVSGSATVGALVVGTSPIFTEGYFESTEQVIPGAGNTLSVAHGLGGLPRFITISLRCIGSEHGWSVGDEIMINSIHMRSDNDGYTAAVNATHFKLRQKGNFQIHQLNSTGNNPIDSTKWRVIFRAWR